MPYKDKERKKQYDKEYRRTHPHRNDNFEHSDKGRAYHRDYHRKSSYNLTREEFEYLIKKQDNKCVICGLEFKKTPDVDHDHITGEVRGLLCERCNLILGLARDNKDILFNAMNYLNRGVSYVRN